MTHTHAHTHTHVSAIDTLCLFLDLNQLLTRKVIFAFFILLSTVYKLTFTQNLVKVAIPKRELKVGGFFYYYITTFVNKIILYT